MTRCIEPIRLSCPIGLVRVTFSGKQAVQQPTYPALSRNETRRQRRLAQGTDRGRLAMKQRTSMGLGESKLQRSPWATAATRR